MAAAFQVNANLNFTAASLQRAAQQVRSALSQVNIPVNIVPTSVSASANQAASALSGTATQINNTSKAANNLGNSFNNTSRSSQRFKQALGTISGNASEFSKSMDAATARVFAFGATAIVLSSVSNAFSALVSNTIKVEAKLTEIKAIFGQTEAQFSQFRDTIFEVAKNTGQSFDTTAEGAAELARQGLSAAETAERLNAALILTRTAGIDAESAVSALTSVINGFTSAGLTANQIVNKIIAVDTAFAVSAKDLSDGFTRAGSTAEDAGVSFDELLGLITALQQRTARGGAVIGNGLKTIFTRIGRGGVIDQLQELGVEIDASQSGVQKLQAIGAAFEEAKGNPIKSGKIKELAAGGFQINLISAALKDLNSETSLFGEASKTAVNASNEAFQRNAELNKTLESRINALSVSLTDVSEKVGQLSFATVLGQALELSTVLSESLENSLSSDAGNTLAKGFFNGIGSFIGGPGALVVAAGFIKVFTLVTGFAKAGLKEIFNINIASNSLIPIQTKINALLQRDLTLNELITTQVTGRTNRTRFVIGALKQEVAERQRRLAIEAQITKEIIRQGGYIKANGDIGFDKSKFARYSRVGKEALQSPAISIVSALGLGAAGSAVKESSNKSTDIFVTGANKQIEALRVSLETLDADVDSIEISRINAKIRDFEEAIQKAGKGNTKFASKIDFLTTGLSSVTLLATISKSLGVVGTALLAANAVADFTLKPYIEDAADKLTAGTTPSESVVDVARQIGRIETEFEKLARITAFLGTQIEGGLLRTISELNARTEAGKLFDKNQQGGIGANINLNKSLFEILKGSKDESVRTLAEGKLSGLDTSSAKNQLLNVLDDITSTVQDSANKKASEDGFGSTSELKSRSLSGFENAALEIFDFLNKESLGGKTLLDRVSNDSLAQDLTTEDGLRAFAEGITKDLSKFSGEARVDTVTKALKDITDGLDTSNQVDELIKVSADIKTLFSQGSGINTEQGVQDFLNTFKSITETGLIPEDQIEKFKNGLLEASAVFGEARNKEIIAAAKKDFEKLQKEREINDKFISDLQGVYEKNITNVRDLREGGVSFTKDQLADPFSKGGSDVLSKLGVTGADQNGILGATSITKFASNLLGKTTGTFDKDGNALNGIVKTIDTLQKSGTSFDFNKDDSSSLKKQLENVDLNDIFNKTAINPAQQRALRPFLDAQETLNNAKGSDDIAKAIELQRQGVRGLSSINPVAGSQNEADIKNFITQVAQQGKIVEGFVNGLGVTTAGSYQSNSGNFINEAQKNNGQVISDKEIAIATSKEESLQRLADLEAKLASIIVTEVAPSFQTLGEALPSTVTGLADFNEKLSKIIGETRTAANESGEIPSVMRGLTDVKLASTAAADSLNEAAKKINKSAEGLEGVGAKGQAFKGVIEDIINRYNELIKYNGVTTNAGPVAPPS